MVQYLFQGVAAFRRESWARKRRVLQSEPCRGARLCHRVEAMTTEPGTDQPHSPPGLRNPKASTSGARPGPAAAAPMVSLVLALPVGGNRCFHAQCQPGSSPGRTGRARILTQSSQQGIVVAPSASWTIGSWRSSAACWPVSADVWASTIEAQVSGLDPLRGSQLQRPRSRSRVSARRLRGLSGLQKLNLSATGCQPGNARGSHRIAVLDLSGTKVTSLEPPAGLARLRSLDLRTPVAGPEGLAGLTALRSLNLSDPGRRPRAARAVACGRSTCRARRLPASRRSRGSALCNR